MKKTKNINKIMAIMLTGLVVLPIHGNAATPNVQTIQFKDGTSQNQSKTITLPANSYIKSINTDNGNVSYTRNGNDVTVNVSNGAITKTTTDPYKYSKNVTDYELSSTNYFNNSKSYNIDGYSGVLSKNGSSYVSSGSYSAPSSKTINDTRSTSTGGSPSYLPSSVYYNDGTFSGNLSTSGSPYVSSGSYTAEMTRSQTDTRSTTYPGESSSNTPTQIFYDAGGFSGWLSKNGSPTVKSGLAPDSKSATDYSYATQKDSTNPFSSTMSYTSGDYSGTLNKSGSPTVQDALYYISGTTAMTQVNRDGVVGPVPSSSGPGIGAWKLEMDAYAHFVKFRTSGGNTFSGYFKSGSVNIDSWTRGWFSGSLPGCGSINGKTKSYDDVVNCATNVDYNSAYDGTPVNHHDSFYRWYWSQLRQTYTGTIYRPDTRIWNQSYSGTVTRPASDTRVWTQNYSGTVYKPESDTRIYRQDYSGTVYKPESINYYDYKVTIDSVVDVEAPNGDLNQETTVWKNDSVDLILSNIKDDIDGSGVKQVRLPNGTMDTSGKDIRYPVTANGTYSFVLEDKAGNTRTKSITVSNIEKVVPTATISQTPTTWTNDLVTLNITNISDTGGSGLDKVKLPNGNFVNGVLVNGDSTSYVVSSNGTYTFEILDNAGNKTLKSITVSNIDKDLPSGTLSQTPTTPTNGDVTLNLSNVLDTGGSGFKQIKLPNGTVVTTTNASQVVTTNGTYTFEIFDNAGNKTLKSITVSNIDKEYAFGTLTQTPSNWTNGDVSLTLSNIVDAGGSGLKQITLPNGTIVTTSTASQVVTTNGTYIFKVEDKAGNVSTQGVIVSNIDKIPPTANISQTPTTPTNKSVTILLSSIYDSGGSQIKKVVGPSGDITSGDSSSYQVNENGTYAFEISDGAGNKIKKEITITNIDKTLPRIEINEKNKKSDSTTVNIKITDFGDITN